MRARDPPAAVTVRRGGVPLPASALTSLCSTAMRYIFLGSYTSDPATGHSNYMEAVLGPSKSKGIYRAEFQEDNGTLQNMELVAEVNISPAWLQWHPDLPILYAVNSTFDGRPR